MNCEQPGDLVLASASPRRRELLARLGVPFTVCTADIDETPNPDELPLEYVQRMAREKIEGVAGTPVAGTPVAGTPVAGTPVAVNTVAVNTVAGKRFFLAADTIGELDGSILIKPQDPEEAYSMLSQMSARSHWVHTAIAFGPVGGSVRLAVCSTRVTFRVLGAEEIRGYIRLGEGLDKAGAYAIQGAAASFVSEINGSYTNVVGLPLSEVAVWLQDAGFKWWQESIHE